MRILVVGGTGTIGQAIVSLLEDRHEVIVASRHAAVVKFNMAERSSIEEMYEQVGMVDAVLSAAGEARFAPLEQLTVEDFGFSIASKLLGQVNLIRCGFAHVRDGGSITVTSGILARTPMVGSGAVSLVNAGLEGFVRAAALEAPRGIRVNAVSPPWVSETLTNLGMDPEPGLPAITVAKAYVESLTGTKTGEVIEPSRS
jgi:NAD(P)-dependent dehydrogenase (short-subunit alcohol dehydrogenase family)